MGADRQRAQQVKHHTAVRCPAKASIQPTYERPTDDGDKDPVDAKEPQCGRQGCLKEGNRQQQRHQRQLAYDALLYFWPVITHTLRTRSGSTNGCTSAVWV